MQLVSRGKRPPMDGGKMKSASDKEPTSGNSNAPPTANSSSSNSSKLLPPPAPLADLIDQCWAQNVRDRPPIDQVFSVFDDEVEPAVKAVSGHLW